MTERPLAESWNALAKRGWLTGDAFAARAAELTAVRMVAAEGLGAGRVFDGHRNGLERLLVHRPDAVPTELRAELTRGKLAVGVWGAEPGPGDGEPAQLSTDGRTVTGVKTFCSGAGLVDLALVLVRGSGGSTPSELVLLDLRARAHHEVDDTWFAAPALAESHSHRVVFSAAPVLAHLGDGALLDEPWISGDALRSAAVWAGAADTILARMMQARPGGEGDEALGRAAAIVGGADAWLAQGLRAVNDAHQGSGPPGTQIAALRLELSERLRALLRLAAEHGGSRALVHDPVLGEACDGLNLLLLQHRLAPVARRLGEALHKTHQKVPSDPT